MNAFVVGLTLLWFWFAPGTCQAAPVFYENTQLTGSYYATSDEIADDVPFTGTFLVDRVQIGYFLPPPDTTDVTIRFYDVASAGGHGNVVAQFFAANQPNGLSLLEVDLAGTGDEFQWSDSRRGYGWVSVQFSDSNAGWLTATGGGGFDVAEDVTGQFFFSFGGAPETSFYLQIHGTQIPEPSTLLLCGISLFALCLRYLCIPTKATCVSG